MNQTVCPEIFTDTLAGYPKYESGFKTIDCVEMKPLQNLVTILFNFVNIGKHFYATYQQRTGRFWILSNFIHILALLSLQAQEF